MKVNIYAFSTLQHSYWVDSDGDLADGRGVLDIKTIQLGLNPDSAIISCAF
jgi:hypothetical protein